MMVPHVSNEFVISVAPVNDQPQAQTALVFFPPIEYNTTTNPNQGSTVNDIVSVRHPISKNNLFTDVDVEDKLGIAVLAVVNSSFGVWKYKTKAGSWQDITDHGQTQKTMKEKGSVKVLYLGPEDSVKFALKDESLLWTNLQALRETGKRVAKGNIA